MCQGVIGVEYKWPHGRGWKRHIEMGIGSHSELTKDRSDQIIKAGCPMDGTEKMIAIESDFLSGWNKFTIESGEPDKADLKLLRAAYKKAAGSKLALIWHVKKCGKIDDALINLLSPEAWAEYERIKAPAWAEYERIKAQALAEYERIKAQALAEYERVKAQALAEYERVKAQALAEYMRVTAPAWAEYERITAQALAEYERITAPAWVDAARKHGLKI